MIMGLTVMVTVGGLGGRESRGVAAGEAVAAVSRSRGCVALAVG